MVKKEIKILLELMESDKSETAENFLQNYNSVTGTNRTFMSIYTRLGILSRENYVFSENQKSIRSLIQFKMNEYYKKKQKEGKGSYHTFSLSDSAKAKVWIPGEFSMEQANQLCSFIKTLVKKPAKSSPKTKTCPYSLNQFIHCPKCRGSFSFRKPTDDGKCCWCGVDIKETYLKAPAV